MKNIMKKIGLTLALFELFLPVNGANPASATVGPSAVAPVTWVGTSPGGASNGEGTCQEGINCETFTLTLTGSPSNWAGKYVRVNIGWLVGRT